MLITKHLALALVLSLFLMVAWSPSLLAENLSPVCQVLMRKIGVVWNGTPVRNRKGVRFLGEGLLGNQVYRDFLSGETEKEYNDPSGMKQDIVLSNFLADLSQQNPSLFRAARHSPLPEKPSSLRVETFYGETVSKLLKRPKTTKAGKKLLIEEYNAHIMDLVKALKKAEKDKTIKIYSIDIRPAYDSGIIDLIVHCKLKGQEEMHIFIRPDNVLAATLENAKDWQMVIIDPH